MGAPDNDKLAQTIRAPADCTRVLHFDHEVPFKPLIVHKLLSHCRHNAPSRNTIFTRTLCGLVGTCGRGFGTGASLRCSPREQSRPTNATSRRCTLPVRPRPESMCLSGHSAGFVLAAASQFCLLGEMRCVELRPESRTAHTGFCLPRAAMTPRIYEPKQGSAPQPQSQRPLERSLQGFLYSACY